MNSPLIRDYMPELDVVRGIAVLLVLFLHGMALPLQGELSTFGRVLYDLSQYGWVGVNLFFVLSGFLITGILLDSRHRPDYFRRFYIRRALRILPALYALLLILEITGLASSPFIAVSFLFLANFAGFLGITKGYGVLWSLAVEEHFYMLWPFIVRKCSLRKLLTLTIVIFLGSPFLRILLLVNPVPQHYASFYTWFNLDGLGLGALLAIWLRMPSFRRAQLARVALPAMLLGGVAFVMLAGHPWADVTLAKTACNLASAGFLSCTLLAGSSKWKAYVDWPIFKFFGFISYGLYLIHILAFHVTSILLSHYLAAPLTRNPLAAMLLHFCGGLVLATAIAYLSRRSLEERFLRIGYSSRRVELLRPSFV